MTAVRLRWLVVGGAALVVVVVVVLVAVLSGGKEAKSPRNVADAFVQAVNARDVPGRNALVCAGEVAFTYDATEDVVPMSLVTRVQVASVTQLSTSAASFRISGTMKGRESTLDFPLRFIDERWCVGR